MFQNRSDAGQQLADRLVAEGIDADLVLGIPRGALPVARPVADALDAALDVVVAQKIGAPNNPELALGAAAADGSVWLNDALIERVGADAAYVERERVREAENAREKESQYRDGPAPALAGKRVVVVDDGVATGATAIACLRQLREADTERVVLAVPVGAPDSIDRLDGEADAVICLEEPTSFGAVGRFYRSFGQVTDEKAMTYLDDENRS